MRTLQEKEADEAIQKAVQALANAAEKAERAGYGDEIRLALADAQKSARYALDVALDRT